MRRVEKKKMIMFFELTRDNDNNYPWWVLVFFFFFSLSLLFLRRVNFPRWVHPVHYFLAPEFLSNSEVIKSIEQCRKYFHVGISTTVGALTGFIFWLSPFLRSYPFEFYHEGMHIYIQVNRTCRLLLDKLNHLPPGSFTPCTDYEVAQLSHLFNQLSSNLLKLSAQVSRLEDPLPFLWSSLLWFVPSLLVLLTFTFLAIRGPRRGVFVFVIPGVTQVPPTFWVRFFFSLIFALLVGVFLWGWRRSGKDFVTFNQELYFPPGTDPSRVVEFFHRLKWFLLVMGLVPLLWMGLDFWWICSCSRSYLFPELNTSGLSQVPLLLDHLHDSILSLRVEESTREDFLLRLAILEDEFYRLSGYLLQLDDVIRSAYPGGATLLDNNLIFFLRRGWGVLSFFIVAGLLFLSRTPRKETTPTAASLMFFFFDGNQINHFLPWGVLSFFVSSFFVFFFLQRVGIPHRVHPVHYVVSSEILHAPGVENSINTARDYLRLSISAVVGANVGVQVWLFPLLSSQPLGIHPDGVYVVAQLQRVCLLLADKFYHPPPSFEVSLLAGLYHLGSDFDGLKNDYFLLFREVALLEGPPPTSWLEIIFLGVVFFLFMVVVILLIRGPRKGTFILVIPAVGQVPLTFWVRFLFPVVLAVGVGLLLWGWRRSGKDLNLFIWESFFPGGTTPAEVITFFNRLKWLLLVTGLAPLVWLGCDFYWIYLNSPSYLFPELNLEGIQGITPRLSRLSERINTLGVTSEVQELLLRRCQVLSNRYDRLVQDLVLADQLVRPHYPGGVISNPATNLTPLFRRITPVVGIAVLVGLVRIAQKEKQQLLTT